MEELSDVLASGGNVLGFSAGVFFCIGNVFNSPKSIAEQASPFWDFSEPFAKGLSAQRAQYIVGAVLLLLAFSLQMASIFVAKQQIALPSCLNNIAILSGVFFVTVMVLFGLGSWLLYKVTLRRVYQHRPSVENETG